MKKKLGLASLFSAVAIVGAAASANSATIVSPVNAFVNSSNTNLLNNIADTYNQNGLSIGFTSGVTDFDVYLATTPTHSFFFNTEWFGTSGSTSAVITYDLGSVLNIDRLALWNEESSGVGSFNLLSSNDNVNFSSLASGLTPFDNPLAVYPAEVFSFAPTSARYFRFVASGCPQPNPGSFPACAIGEVAFSASTQQVPEPSGIISTSVLAVGLIGRKILKNRRNRAFASTSK